MSIKDNLQKVNERIYQAAKRAGRNPKLVKLVVAGKYANMDLTRKAIRAGATIIGENKDQDLKRKYLSLKGHADWHFIGHLQRNKVKSIVKKVSLIHSLDSLRLAEEVDKQSRNHHRKSRCLIEVNTSKEKSKFGVSLSETSSLISKCLRLKNLKVVGLMTMGIFTKNPEENRLNFRQLNQLANQHSLKHRSMGTSQDFEVAIEEGATLVRIGSAIFK